MSTTKVSAHLRAIIDMADRLEARAIDQARRGERLGSDPLGGDAMVNLGIAPNFAALAAHREELERRALDPDDPAKWPEDYEDPNELWTSLELLRWWSEDWRRQLGMDHEDPTWRPSLRSEAAFLRNPDVLAWAWDNELHWDDFAGDVATARRKLEDVLREGTRTERIRVTCPDCETIDEATGETRSGKRLYVVYGETRDDDRWKCPECKHRFDRERVQREATRQMNRAGVAQKWITFADALAILRKQGWQEKIIRRWAHDATEVSRDASGPLPRYWWPDLWRCHLLHRWEVSENRRKAQERAKRKASCIEVHGDDCWVFGKGCAVSLGETKAV